MQTRGRQSWGWTDGNKQIVKSTGPIMDEWNHTLTGWKTVGLHTRQATTGGITSDNSHPWQIGSILGMHNGMVYNHAELNKKYDRKFAVDSMHILANIDEGKPLSEIESYGAIVYWQNGKLHMGRWNNGDLSLARAKFGWAWASTKTALQHSLECAGFETDEVSYYNLKEGRLYVIDGPNIVKSSLKLDFSRGTSKDKWENYGKCGGTGSGSYTSNYGRTWRWDATLGRMVEVSSTETTPTPAKKYTEKDVMTAEEVKTASGGQTVDDRIGEMLDKAADNKPTTAVPGKMLESSYCNQGAVSEKDSRPLEAKWKCARCNSELHPNIDYCIDVNCCLVCNECSIRYPETVVAGPFVLLPNEIMTVDSMFSDAERKANMVIEWPCEFCSESLRPDDPLIETPDGQLVCIECWRETAMTIGVREQQDAFEDEKAEDLLQQYQNAVDRDDFHDQGPIGMDETPPMNEAESLKQFGAGIPTKEELFDMPTKASHLQ